MLIVKFLRVTGINMAEVRVDFAEELFNCQKPLIREQHSIVESGELSVWRACLEFFRTGIADVLLTL